MQLLWETKFLLANGNPSPFCTQALKGSLGTPFSFHHPPRPAHADASICTGTDGWRGERDFCPPSFYFSLSRRTESTRMDTRKRAATQPNTSPTHPTSQVPRSNVCLPITVNRVLGLLPLTNEPDHTYPNFDEKLANPPSERPQFLHAARRALPLARHDACTREEDILIALQCYHVHLSAIVAQHVYQSKDVKHLVSGSPTQPRDIRLLPLSLLHDIRALY